jgi:hypothetical protein
MKYYAALSIAAKATAYLQEKEGSMSGAEVALYVSALDIALKAIANHNSVELPPRPKP